MADATAPVRPVAPADPEARRAYLASLDCVHCGLCTQHCPTYRVTGEEGKNPRGRIYLMRARLEGRAETTPDLVEDLDSCLVCRACESVCPSGVRFGDLMAQARAEIRRPGRLRRFLLRDVVPDRRRRARLASLLRFVQATRLDALRFLLPPRLRRLVAAAPRVPSAQERRPAPRRVAAIGARRGTVAVFEGCVASDLFPEVHRATLRLLQHAGFDVVVPQEQTCCGALHEHDGDAEFAHRLAAQNAAVFSDPTLEAVILNSAGCGAALKDAGRRAATEQDGAPVAEFARRVVDWSRFLVDRAPDLAFVAPEDEPSVVATYDAPCHLLHAQGEADAPLALLRRAPGVELRPMALADLCCGAAGVYSVDRPDMAREILEPKLDALVATGARVLLTGNPGCLIQWRAGVAARGLDVRVEHPATFLAARLAPR